MDLTSLKTIKNLLNAYGARPAKALGQNFLVDKAALDKIIKAADIQPNDKILEIGPGLGVLTQELAKKAKKVVAVEKDRKMIEILGETLKDYKNVEVIHSDIRKFDFSETPGVDEETPGVKVKKSNFHNFKVVGNLPFYLAAPVIRQLLERTDSRCLYAVLVVQKEVAQRICPARRQAGAKPPRMNLLAVSVQFYAEPKIISYIPKTSFWPSPEVDAAIIKITPSLQSIQTPDVCTFFKIIRVGFSQPRKQLVNNLSHGLGLDKKKAGEWLLENNIQPTQRAETLTINDWKNLTFSADMLK